MSGIQALKKRIEALQLSQEDGDPLILSWLFPPCGIRRSRVRFKWAKEGERV